MHVCRKSAPHIVPFVSQDALEGNPLELRVRDWLATQSLVIEAWLEDLVAENADIRLIAVLSQHAAFLKDAVES
ncbi:MAG: hypothetical protein ACK4NO_04910 [Glycocaulis sp.]